MQTRLFTDGQFTDGLAGHAIDVISPADGSLLAQVAEAGSEDVDLGVGAAQRAFPGWAARPAAERGRLLTRLADLIEAKRRRTGRARVPRHRPPDPRHRQDWLCGEPDLRMYLSCTRKTAGPLQSGVARSPGRPDPGGRSCFASPASSSRDLPRNGTGVNLDDPFVIEEPEDQAARFGHLRVEPSSSILGGSRPGGVSRLSVHAGYHDSAGPA